jgi:lipopolysaccharide biosynthesis glycosyltransferase
VAENIGESLGARVLDYHRSVGISGSFGMVDCAKRFKRTECLPGTERLRLVLACDEAYAMPLATALRSIVEANRGNWPLDCHILTDGFSEAAKRRVSESLPDGAARIQWVAVSMEPFRGFYTAPHVSVMTFARLLIPRAFPDTVSRLLYLDTDILVLDDLMPLWETDLEGAVVGAVLDGLDRHLTSGTRTFAGVPRVRGYFNAGVLLIDLERWRKQGISEAALEYHTRFPSSPYMDQDGINVACDGLWKCLDSGWNFQDHFARKIEAIAKHERPSIVHFVTGLKPWKVSSGSINASFYDSFRSRTKFRRSAREKYLDVLGTSWYRSKRMLGRLPFLRVAWNKLKQFRKARAG